MSERFILLIELNVKEIIDVLKDLNILRPDTDPDFWVKTCSGIIYSFASRMMLGIGDNSPDFSGMGMLELLRYGFDMMLKINSVRDEK
jgi:hypothetical protein